MLKTCKICNQTKNAKEFSFTDRYHKTRKNICKECEAEKNKRIKEQAYTQNCLRAIRENFTRLAGNMQQKDVDQLFYTLKEIYKKVHANDS